jgi:hypothetical protein
VSKLVQLSLRFIKTLVPTNLHDLFHAGGHHHELVNRRSGDNFLIEVDVPIEGDVSGIDVQVIGLRGWILGNHCLSQWMEGYPEITGPRSVPRVSGGSSSPDDEIPTTHNRETLAGGEWH